MAAEDDIRRLILGGELLPGQKVHQGDLAHRLGLSRIPIREALATLVAQGLVRHRPNTGYTVTVPTADEMHEIYLLRKLLETELIKSVTLAEVDLAAMEHWNRVLGGLDPHDNFDDYREANRQFHFALFEASPLGLFRREVTRIWTLSEFYRSLYIQEPGAGQRVLDDHSDLIEAIRQGDLARVLAVSDAHRAGTQRSLARVLRGR